VEDVDDDGVGSLQSSKFVVTGSLWPRGLVRGTERILGCEIRPVSTYKPTFDRHSVWLEIRVSFRVATLGVCTFVPKHYGGGLFIE
jgi:hypothetical protein